MTESIINALVHLFAIIESVKEDIDLVDSGEIIVKPYLSKTLNQELSDEYLKLFYDYLAFYRAAKTDSPAELGIDSTSILQVAKICNHLNKELLSRERTIVFLQLLELIYADQQVTQKENEFISLVAMNFNLRSKEVDSLKSFIIHPDGKDIDKHNGMIIDNKMTEWPKEVTWLMRKKQKKIPGGTEFHHLYVENLFGKILILRVESVDTYFFKYTGPLNLYLEGNRIVSGKFYILKPGSIIKGPNIRSIYESEIIHHFLQTKRKEKIVLTAENLEYRFGKSQNGIQKFNFIEESGNLVGIMGGSGVGKSTLINLLNGKLAPTAGKVHINGYSIQKASNKGVIGYVPQDDLLFEELTVYQNLYYNAKICFSDFSEQLIRKTINKVLEDLDLQEIKDLKVGDPLNKFISGGQRKRLNIALELMRGPTVLFVDEPTSGLSSMDSEKVMLLLKELTRNGKLVIVIIHQPSSDIFKLLDKLWLLDKGGYPIYNGNPIDAVVYFKTMSTQVNAAESECPRCGNVIPEQILHVIEAKEIDYNGIVTNKRRVSPKQWYQKYKSNLESKQKKVRYEERLPPTNFNIPSYYHQFRIFFERNFISKLSNKQYIFINLLEAPLLAFILAYFSMYAPHGNYVFSENKNLPVYLFMAVVVALFMGMSVSAEEIFKDRKILERESFLNLSRSSYLNSKIAFLFALSAIQSLSFVWVGNYILEIKGMTLSYSVILFSTACFANLVGLNISSALNSIVTIYIIIPFILVPQLLLGGAMIKFDELHGSLAKQAYVPLVGDLMTSRWAYEALSVAQYKTNRYQTHFFDVEQKISSASFERSYRIPQLADITLQIVKDSADYTQHTDDFHLLKNELENLNDLYAINTLSWQKSLTAKTFSTSAGNRLLRFLEKQKDSFHNRYRDAINQKDSIYTHLIKKTGQETFNQLKHQYYNESISDLVKNRSGFNSIIRENNRLVRKKEPIYMEPYTKIGRAHFYSAYKVIGPFRIDTIIFNVLIIWLMTGLLYLTLVNGTLKRVILFLSGNGK